MFHGCAAQTCYSIDLVRVKVLNSLPIETGDIEYCYTYARTVPCQLDIDTKLVSEDVRSVHKRGMGWPHST